MKVVLPLPPSVNAYRKYRVMTTYRGGKPIHTVQTYKSTETKQFEANAKRIIKESMKKYGWETPSKERFVIAHTVFYFARINQDDNNYYKVPLDAFEEAGAILNDSKIMVRTENIFVDSKNPRMEIVFEVSEKIGVFDSEQDMEDFKLNNCANCKRSKRNCKLFNDFLENKNISQIEQKTVKKCSELKKL